MTKIIHAILLIGSMLWLPLYAGFVSAVQVEKDLTWIHNNLATDGTPITDAEMVFSLEASNDGVTWVSLAVDIPGTSRLHSVVGGLDDTVQWHFRMYAIRTVDGATSAASTVATWNIPNAEPNAPGGLQVVDPTPVAGVGIFINSGGRTDYVAADGSIWAADYAYLGGNFATTTAVVTNSLDPELHKTSRFMNGDLSYSVPTPPGSYTVELVFSETLHNAIGARIMDVQIEGQVVEAAMDIFAQAGGANLELIKSYSVTVADNSLDLVLMKGTGTTVIQALQVN